jgi:hypothetical protein
MQHGDLAVSTIPRMVVILEGVLASVSPIERTTFLRRRTKVTGYNIQWYDVPLKRCVYLKDRFPESALDLVTFVSPDLRDDAANFLDEVGIPFNSLTYSSFEGWVWALRFRPDIRAIYDSDPFRLHYYGQLGTAVLRGLDF